jgi:hypothetical protein
MNTTKQELKLGKLGYKPQKNPLQLKNYIIESKLPKIPDISKPFEAFKDDWLMLGNDQYGDCVWAGAGHEHMLWNAENNNPFIITEKNILKAYSDVTGFNPKNPNSDQGTVVSQAMDYRIKKGLLDANGKRHKLIASPEIDNKNENAIKTAAFLIDGVGIGFEVPSYAMEQFQAGQPWEYEGKKNIEGGHYVPIVGYDADYLYCVTWQKIQKMSIDFYEKLNDESWAPISPDLFKNNKSPDGLDLATIQSDVKILS